MKLRHLLLGEKSYVKHRQCIKKQRHHFADKGPHCLSYGFSSSHVPTWESDHEEGWAPKNWCFQIVVRENTFESPLSLELQGDQSNQSYRKSTLNIHWKNWCWSSNTLATWCKKPTHWKRPWCQERLKTTGESDNRGWGGWMASLMQWTLISANSGR